MVNKVILVGNVGKDPEVRHLENNLVYARFSLATNERWSKDGNKVEHTEWHQVIVWRSLAEIVEKYVRKGNLLFVDGRIRSRSYDDKDGIKRSVVEIVADSIHILNHRIDGNSAQQSNLSAQFSSETPIDSNPPDDLPF